MAFDKVIDSAKLDADLTSIADAIRERAGTTGKLAFPAGYESAVKAIPDLLQLKIKNSYLALYENHTITELSANAFNGWSGLKAVDLPELLTIKDYAFQGVGAQQYIFPKVTSVGTSAFAWCGAVNKFDFHALVSIGNNAFSYTSNLRTLIIRTDTVCTLGNTGAFTSTPIASGTGYIYVPSALVDSYKAATNWSNYAAQFRALEDYTVDGTTTGELDPDKI